MHHQAWSSQYWRDGFIRQYGSQFDLRSCVQAHARRAGGTCSAFKVRPVQRIGQVAGQFKKAILVRVARTDDVQWRNANAQERPIQEWLAAGHDVRHMNFA